MCRRKKDHGRAEALLLAAWGVGVRRTSTASASTEDDSLDELEETDLSEFDSVAYMAFMALTHQTETYPVHQSNKYA